MSQWRSNMANRIGLGIQHRLPVVLAGGVYPCPSSYSVTCAIGSVHPSLKALKKWTSGGGGGRAPRRLILGLGVSFWTQYMSMAGGSVGGNSFIAFARQKGAVEEVNLSPFIYLNVGLVSGFSCMFNFEDWLVLYWWNAVIDLNFQRVILVSWFSFWEFD